MVMRTCIGVNENARHSTCRFASVKDPAYPLENYCGEGRKENARDLHDFICGVFFFFFIWLIM